MNFIDVYEEVDFNQYIINKFFNLLIAIISIMCQI